MRHVAAACVIAVAAASGCREHSSVTPPSDQRSAQPQGSARLNVEEHSPAVGNGVLVEDVGIETLGGVFTVLLRRGVSVPTVTTEVFSTATDNQQQIQVRLYRGTAPTVAQNTSLGPVVISKLPPGPRGTVMVEVTFRVDGETIALEAREQSGARIELAKRGAVEQRDAPDGRRHAQDEGAARR